MKRLLILIFCINVMITFKSEAQVSLLWENDSITNNPESIVYDDIRQCCYVSNFGRSPANGMTYNEDYVSKFNLKGELLERKFVSNLTAPTGLCLLNDKLYIVERFGIVKYDLEQNKVETRFRINSTKFLNDVAVDSDENIYVTASDTNIIYRIKDAKVEEWVGSALTKNPNGIICDGDKIIVGICSDNTVKSITIADKKITKIAKLGTESGVIDGIKKYGNDYLVSHYQGIIYQVHSDGQFFEILNTTKEGIFCADFEFIESQRLFVIPTLRNNRVAVYKFQTGIK